MVAFIFRSVQRLLASQFPRLTFCLPHSFARLTVWSPHSLLALQFTCLTVCSPYSLLASQFARITVWSPHSLLTSQFARLTVYSPHSLLALQLTHLVTYILKLGYPIHFIPDKSKTFFSKNIAYHEWYQQNDKSFLHQDMSYGKVLAGWPGAWIVKKRCIRVPRPPSPG